MAGMLARRKSRRTDFQGWITTACANNIAANHVFMGLAMTKYYAARLLKLARSFDCRKGFRPKADMMKSA
jgi:hypothetical protein